MYLPRLIPVFCPPPHHVIVVCFQPGEVVVGRMPQMAAAVFFVARLESGRGGRLKGRDGIGVGATTKRKKNLSRVGGRLLHFTRVWWYVRFLAPYICLTGTPPLGHRLYVVFFVSFCDGVCRLLGRSFFCRCSSSVVVV